MTETKDKDPQTTGPVTASILGNDRLSMWDDFVKAHPEGTIYHTAGWRSIIEDTYGHQPRYYILTNAESNIVAGLPAFEIKSRLFGSRICALPAAAYCDPLYTQPEHSEILIKSVIRQQQADHIPLVELKFHKNTVLPADLEAESVEDYCIHTLDIRAPYQQIETGFHKSCIRRAIKRAHKAGLELRAGTSEQDVRLFYRLYLDMRRETGLLPQPRRFFSLMVSRLAGQGSAEILTAFNGGTAVSALLLLKFKNSVIYEYGATRQDAHSLQPSPFLLDQALRRAQSEGYSQFDFGRTHLEHAGLVTFKSRWGSIQQNLATHYLPRTRGTGSMRRTGTARKLMSAAIRISPRPLATALGGLLYRHFI